MPNTNINLLKLIKILKEHYFPQETNINIALFGNANCMCLREIRQESLNKLTSGSDDVQVQNRQTRNLVLDDIHTVCCDIKRSLLLVVLLTNSFNVPIWIYPKRVLHVNTSISGQNLFKRQSGWSQSCWIRQCWLCKQSAQTDESKLSLMSVCMYTREAHLTLPHGYSSPTWRKMMLILRW